MAKYPDWRPEIARFEEQARSGGFTLRGTPGDDLIDGSDGQDRLFGGGGDDLVRGFGGNDELTGGSGADILRGGEGFDTASYRNSPSQIFVNLTTKNAAGGHAAGDTLFGIENIEGSNGADIIVGGQSDNELRGLLGGDSLHGKAGRDRVDGGGGKDFLTSGGGRDLILGGSGDDLIDAGTGRDLVVGGSGGDVIYGGPDLDVIIYDFAWEQMRVRYSDSNFSIWVNAPDGRDHIFSALTIATTTGTYRYDVPTASWVFDSAKTGDDWLSGW